MDKPRWKDRTVLEQFAEFDLSKISGSSPSSPLVIKSLSLSTGFDSQTLIYVGTNGGKVILLSFNPSTTKVSSSNPDENGGGSPTSGSYPVRTVKFVRSISVGYSPVESIDILVEINRVIVVLDGFLFLLHPFLLHPARKLSFAKSVSAISKRFRCTDSASSDPLGDVGSKAELSTTRQRLLQKLGAGIPANGARARASGLHREGENNCFIAVAAGKRLLLIKLFVPGNVDRDTDDGGISVAFKETQGIDGVCTMAWLDDSIVVGTIDGYTLFSVGTGQSTPLFSLPESSGAPQLKFLCRSKEALLLVDNVGVVVNAFGQPVGGSLIFQCAPDSIAEMPPFVVISNTSRIDLYQKKIGNCVQSISLTKGCVDPCIVASDDQGNGELIVAATPYKVVFFRKVSAEEQIKDLLRKKYFKEAISLVEELESEGEITKEMLSLVHAQVGFLLLFDLHFEDAVNHFLLSENMQPSEIFPFIMREPNRWSSLVPRNRYWGLHPPPVPLEEVVDDGLMAIQRAIFLKKAGVESAVDESFLLNPPNKADLLKVAIENIIRYLQVSRDKDLSPSTWEGVDTLLMYLYRALNYVDDMEKLASSQNSCIVEELETLLDDSGHLRTLAFLYASKGMSSKALSIWRILARNYSAGLWDDIATTVVHDSVGVTTLISGQKAAAIEASKLLEESSDQDIILQHLGWIADEDQDLAVRVLTSDKRANHLAPEDVLATIDPKMVEIQQRYLQWLIEDQDSDDARFHTLYALSLAKSVIEAIEMDGTIVDSIARRFDSMHTSDAASGSISKDTVRQRLQFFLQSSDLYDPEEVLYLIEESNLWLEKAILYRKLGQETLVLQILALKLEDSAAAEQYCAEIGRPDAYMELLGMYLNPPEGKEPMFNAAVRLLHNHGESLDPLQVLEKLSHEMPLQLAADTILRMLKARVHHHRQGQIVHNLSSALNLEAQLARLEERSRHMTINDETTCDSCHARLGTKLFAMYPDDSVVCYKCYRRQGESTSSTGHNFKEDIIFKPGWLVSRQP